MFFHLKYCENFENFQFYVCLSPRKHHISSIRGQLIEVGGNKHFKRFRMQNGGRLLVENVSSLKILAKNPCYKDSCQKQAVFINGI